MCGHGRQRQQQERERERREKRRESEEKRRGLWESRACHHASRPGPRSSSPIPIHTHPLIYTRHRPHPPLPCILRQAYRLMPCQVSSSFFQHTAPMFNIDTE
ncbi:hypothetical protein BCR37DRAFT_382647 [Protomyces lactucae-debilis]|uniref:Uncharacterized protein n=1 Tax=Protomyces lactucae-debilis TaxID=2754530 RepID=A0A1Y2F1L1_PROLT|nr:uncharacterized protein BCR37DRAFT_382647 [Protomyces lactucae-debilis]ORY77749.1 hypothetical protein BCR37DRAFT_382647 [Protomyces lactucae-debilis]